MIVSFAVTNFRSIRDEQSVSFLTTSDKTSRDLLSVEVANGVYVNKLAIFYGTNASGKSNMLQAMEALFWVMSTPAKDKNATIKPYCPFKLDGDLPTQMKIEFYVDGRRYEYGVKFGGRIIEEEQLYYVPKRTRSLFYSRRYAGVDSQPEIVFGNTLGLTKKTKESIREATFNNHSVLSTVAKLSLRDDAVELKSLYNWVMGHVRSINGDAPSKYYISELNKVNSDQRKKELYTKLLAKADFNITGFKLVDKKANLSKKLVTEIIGDGEMPDDQRLALLYNVVFTNRSESGDFELPLELQSEGTLRFIELMDALYDLVTSDQIYFLDELGNRMHYDLIVYYLMLFLYNSEASQVFFTTQSVLLLDEDFVRRDIVYLAEKDASSAATAYVRVSDLGLHKNQSLYNAYRLGKLGSRPELGSPYLNLKKV